MVQHPVCHVTSTAQKRILTLDGNIIKWEDVWCFIHHTGSKVLLWFEDFSGQLWALVSRSQDVKDSENTSGELPGRKTFPFFYLSGIKWKKKGSRRNECNQNSSTFFRFSSREDLRFINSRSLTEVKCIPPGKHGKNRPSPTSETLALPWKKCIALVIEQTPVQTSVDTDEPLVCAASLLGPSQLWTSHPSAVREEHNERVLLKHMGSECLP